MSCVHGKSYQVARKSSIADTTPLHMPQSLSMDTISSTQTSTGNTPSDEHAHTPLSRSSSRPRWDQRPSLAECQVCGVLRIGAGWGSFRITGRVWVLRLRRPTLKLALFLGTGLM